MRGASEDSLAAARQRLDPLLRAAGVDGTGVDAARVGDDLLAISALLDANPGLRRALTDIGRDGAARAGLMQLVFAGQVSPDAADLAAGAARDRWGTPSDLSAALEELGLDAYLVAAERAGRLDAVEDELFRFARIVEARADLRAALTDRAAPVASRRALVHRLLEGRAAPETLRLVEHVVLGRRERSLDAALEHLSDLAARRRQHVVATVRVAAPLTEEHRRRLVELLGRRQGAPVDLNVVVEPDVVGGILVEVGDEIIDATMASRLADARRHLAD